MSRIVDRLQAKSIFIILFLLIAACTPETPPEPAATVNAQVPITTLRPTNTVELPITTSTNTVEPTTPTVTLVAVSSATPPPTRTRRPTPIPSPSATTLFPQPFSFPDWVQLPDSAVLLASIQRAFKEDNVVALVNAITGEVFEILATDELRNPSWLETNTGLSIRLNGYLSSGSNPDHVYIPEINIFTGEERQIQLSTIYGKGQLSPDGRFSVDVVGEPGARTVTIINQETEQEFSLANPFGNHYSFGVGTDWSYDSKLLAVSFFGVDETNPELYVYSMAIYDTEGNVFRTYTNLDFFRAWTTDGSYRLLALEGTKYGERIPCVVDLDTDAVDCLTEVISWRENEGVNTGSYEWLPDGIGISFIYWQKSGERKAGLCIINSSNQDITCPVNETHIAPATLGAEVGGMAYLVNYKWSPDGRYIALEIDPFGPGSDDRTLTQLATIARDGSQFYIWGFGYLGEAEWRPPLETTN